MAETEATTILSGRDNKLEVAESLNLSIVSLMSASFSI